MSPRWLNQIVTIENKGFQAFLDGKLEKDCPYQSGYHNQNGDGGQLQRQRRLAWVRGWKLAEQQKKEEASGQT